MAMCEETEEVKLKDVRVLGFAGDGWSWGKLLEVLGCRHSLNDRIAACKV